MIWVTSASPPPARRWGQPSDPNRAPEFYERSADHPYRAMALNGWPVAFGLLVFAVLFAFFFPLLGILLAVSTPLAILAAYLYGMTRARLIRVQVTDDVITVGNARTGNSCDRAEIHTAVVVQGLRRRITLPRTTDLILLDARGRTLLLVPGLLFSAETFDDIIDLIRPATVDRLTGAFSPESLTQRYPLILHTADGRPPSQRSMSGIVLLVAMALVLIALVYIAFVVFFR